MKNKLGFTLIELLVVVLIIGILASIALPQYRMAVTKSRVASMLPLMRRWKDAFAEYKLQHGDYGNENDGIPNGDVLGVTWPSDWNNGSCGNNVTCSNDYWFCFAGEEYVGNVYCSHDLDNGSYFLISMYQPDDEMYEDLRNLMVCEASDSEGSRVCQRLGGEIIEGARGCCGDFAYRLN